MSAMLTYSAITRVRGCCSFGTEFADRSLSAGNGPDPQPCGAGRCPEPRPPTRGSFFSGPITCLPAAKPCESRGWRRALACFDSVELMRCRMASNPDVISALPIQCPNCDQQAHHSVMEQHSEFCGVCGHLLTLEGKDWHAAIAAISKRLNEPAAE
jgi:hypothetical protein